MKLNNKQAIIDYLSHIREKKNAKFPPTDEEIINLVSYLKANGLDPIIVGAIAVINYLQLTASDIKNDLFRRTQDIDVFVSKALPLPPQGWKRDMQSIGVTSWISPKGGSVDFLIGGHQFPDSNAIPRNIEKDKNSSASDWPIADLTSLFLLKLNSFREKDLFDLVVLASRAGIPPQLKNKSLNETQRSNLETVQLYLDHKDLLK